jgi:transcriptional regulator
LYINAHFRVDDVSVLHRIVDEARFGLLVSAGDGIDGTHIPFVLHREEGELGALIAHTPRADRSSRRFDGTAEMLAVFTGPVAYVSPTWYEEPGLPTYNFAAVHAYGRPCAIVDRDRALEHLRELVEVHERERNGRWTLADAPAEYIETLLPHIAPFRMEIERIEGKLKLSQNKSRADRLGVSRGLRERGRDDDLAIAALMDRYPYQSDKGRPILPELSIPLPPYQPR